MDPRDEYYLSQAVHCRKMAEQSRIIQIRTGWLALSAKWLQMIREPGAVNPAQIRIEPRPKTGSDAD